MLKKKKKFCEGNSLNYCKERDWEHQCLVVADVRISFCAQMLCASL